MQNNYSKAPEQTRKRTDRREVQVYREEGDSDKGENTEINERMKAEKDCVTCK